MSQSQQSFIDKVARHITSNHDLRKESLTVVFPNKRAAYSLRHKLCDLVEDTIWLPKIMSIEEVVTQWSGYELAGRLDVIFELVAVDNEIHPGRNSDISKFGGKAAQMASDFDEVDNYMINARDLFSYVTDMKKIGLWDVTSLMPKERESEYILFYQSLYDYYTRLRERLHQQKKGYYGMITRMLAETGDEELMPKTKGDKIVFAGFNALTSSEETLIDKLVKLGVAETLWDFDSYYVNDTRNEAGDFARELMRKHPDWFKNGIGFSNNLLEKERNITVIDTAGNSLQAKALQEQLSLNNNIGKDTEAIVLVNEDLLIPVLNSIPDNIGGQKVKISMGYPIRITPTEGLANLFFRLHRRRFKSGQLYIWPLIEIIELDIVKLVFSEAELDKIVRWKNDKLGKNDYSVKRDDIGLGKDSDIERLILLMTDETDNPAELVAKLKDILILISLKAERSTNPNAQFVKTQVNETYKIVNRIDEMLRQHTDCITDNETIESLYKTVSRETTVKISSESTDGLQIMGLLETRNLDFSTIHLLSANEGSLPKNVNSGSFIPYFIRCTMGMPDNKKKQSVFAYHFYRLLQNCEKAFIYYNSDKEAEGDKSRFVMQIERELVPLSGGKTKLDTIHFVNSNSPKDSFVGPISITKTESVMNEIKAKLKKGLAPTSLQRYVECPLKFCLTYVFNISDNTVDENVQANQIGDTVHKAMEDAFKKHKDNFIGKDQLNGIKKAALDYIDNQNIPQNGYNYLNKVIIEKFINNYFKTEEGGFTLIGTETKMSSSLPVSDPKGNIAECLIFGSADRIDRLNDGKIRICDYKTDSTIKSGATKVANKDTDIFENIPEKARQLLIYKYLYLKSTSNVNPENICASILGLTGYSNLYHDLIVENDNLNNDFINTMEGLLKSFISGIIDPETPFTQTEEIIHCRFCDFRSICGKEKEKW